jgi:hypothetical protein
VLLDRRFLEVLSQRLDIGRDVQRFDVSKLADMRTERRLLAEQR